MLNGSTTVVQFFTGGYNMTSVLPAWKLELIQKKKLKEQGERQKLEDERSRKVSIPEWKRSLLEKKKEGANDSPETKEQAQSVNSVFGPRIIRKTSEKTIAIVNASQRPDAKADDGKLSKKKVFEDNPTQNHSPLYSSPADSNSCVTNVVEIPTEEERKPNKCGSLQREAKDYRESTQRGVALLKDDSKTPVSRYAQSTGLNSFKTKVDSEPVKTPSVLSYKRMFEQSKAEKNDISDLRIVKGTDNMKADVRSDKRTAEGKLFAANDESQLQTLNKDTEHNAQSIHMEKSTSLNVRKTVPSISPKPLKNFVSTPPWLRNSSLKSVPFPAGKNSVQETMVGNINNEVENISKDIHKYDHNSLVIKTSDVMQKGKEDVNPSGTKIPEITAEPVRETLVQPDYKGRESPSLQDHSVQNFSVVKQSDVKEKQKGVKSVKGNESQKYVVITSGNRPEFAPLNEKLLNDVNRDDASQVPNGQESQKDSHESSDDYNASQSTIASLRSMFGPSAGFRRHTSSEENLALKVNQPEPTEHGSVLRKPGQNRRTQPSTVRWSADVLSLMSQPMDDDEDDDNKLMTLPQSDSNIPSSTNSQAKRPPPPTKRWTADVLSVGSQLDENDLSNLSPRSDSNRTFSPSSSLERGRSSSLTDIREERGCAYFQHKPNVSQGIEHRMHKLIKKASVSEINIDPDENESDSVSDDELSGLNDLDFKSSEAPNVQGTINDEITDHTLTDSIIMRKDSQLDLSSTEQEIQPVFTRKRSVSHDIEQRVSELFHRQLSQQSDQDGAETDDKNNLEDESNIIIDQVVEIDQKCDPEKLFNDPAAVEKPMDFASPSSEEASKGDSDHVVQESKPSKGSVHKLSALFGSSIWKGNKKDKNGLDEKAKIKPSVEVKRQKVPPTEQSSQNQLLQKKEDNKKSNLFSKSQKKEEKSVEKKEKDQSSVNRFPWLKKFSKSEQQYEGSKITDVPGKKQKNNVSSSTDTTSITAHKLGPVRKAGELEEEIASSNQEGAEEKSGENKIIRVKSKNRNNGFIPTTEGVDTVLGAAHSLRPVRKSGKVEQTLVGKLKIISNASYEQAPPKGVYHKPKSSVQPPQEEKKKLPAEVPANSKEASSRKSETHIPVVVTQHWNGHQESPESEESMNEAVPVSSIDEVPVSAIDIPESGESDVIVSVIDVPSSPDVHNTEKFLNGSNDKAVHVSDDISVSVIDLPSPVAKEDEPNTFQGGYLEADEFSDESDTDEVEGSYDFATGEVTHLVNGNIGSDDDDDDEEEEEDDDEDEDVPISYIGSAPQYQVPQVVFDSEPVELKSCLSPKTARRKVRSHSNHFLCFVGSLRLVLNHNHLRACIDGNSVTLDW